jgi:hypothetical protein
MNALMHGGGWGGEQRTALEQLRGVLVVVFEPTMHSANSRIPARWFCINWLVRAVLCASTLNPTSTDVTPTHVISLKGYGATPTTHINRLTGH